MAARPFVVSLTLDDVASARDIGRRRGELHPRKAIGEKVLAVGLRRSWDGEFTKLGAWKIWTRLGMDVRGIDTHTEKHFGAALPISETAPSDHVFVLLMDHNAPNFVIVGWILGKLGKTDAFWNEKENKFLVPPTELRMCWELRKERRQTKERIRETDEGLHPKRVGRLLPSKWALPCQRCQKIVPAGSLSTWSVRTGWIHGDPTECGFKPEGA